MTKTQFVADLKTGQEVNALFLLASAQQGQARNGPFWRLELKDSTGSLEAKIWSPQSQFYPDLRAGDLVTVEGRVTMYRERLEVAVDRMTVLSSDEKNAQDLTQFMPASERLPQDMLEDLRGLCKKYLTHSPWRKLVLGLLSQDDVVRDLPLAAAAKGMHHAYAGGLIEHTLAVAELCMTLSDLYPQLDRQTLLAGAVCHDLGKLWELSHGLTIDYTEPGRLLGHIQLMLEKLDPLMRKAGLEEHLALHLKHLVLSHHGQLEFGSPKLPASAEALILHYADNIDAKLNQVKNALSAVEPDDSGWSSYVPGLDRFVYRAPRSPETQKKNRSCAKGENAKTEVTKAEVARAEVARAEASGVKAQAAQFSLLPE